MTFVDHIGSIVSKLARILGFIKQISREFNDPYMYKTVYVCTLKIINRRCSVKSTILYIDLS
jgi:hypothetical protein